MMLRKTTAYRGGDILDVEEHPDGRYGAPGSGRMKKRKLTPEQMAAVNHFNKVKRCRGYLLEYFNPGDIFCTWTYKVEERPADLKAAIKDFRNAIRKIKKEYAKTGVELYWIRNIECGSRGAWHIHLVINAIKGAADLLRSVWTKGGMFLETISTGKFYDQDFRKLAEYICKDANTRPKKKNGARSKEKIKESSWSHSRNMHLPKPKKEKLKRWKREVKPKKGYYIERIHEGINPFTGLRYRKYTMIRLNRRI